MTNLNSNSFAAILDMISEGEIEGLKDGKKSIYLNNVALLNATAVVKAGTYSQASGTITVTLTAHGYAAGELLVLDITSGNAVSDGYTIGNVTADTFTVPAKDQTTTSGAVLVTRSADYNFSNVSVHTRNGTNDQTYIPGTNEISNEIGVGVKVLKSVPVVRTTTNQLANAARVTLGFPRLQSFADDGSIGGSTVRIKIDIQYAGTGFANVVDDTVSGRSDDNYQKDYIINFKGSFPVDIRVSRETADSTSPKVINECNWTSYTEIVYQKLNYPNSALVSLRFSAEQFANIPQRSYWIRGIKLVIPSNATVNASTGALVYDGAWNGTFAAVKQWTSDPAWCLWALLTNTRFGFGNYLNPALLDKWAFLQASKYASALNTYTSAAEIADRATRGLAPRTGITDDYDATTGRHGVPDGFGKYEPRFSCNVNIQTAEEAYTLINNLCSVLRAMPFWATGSLTVTQDKPVASSYLFTLGNINEEGFTYSGSSQKSRATVAIISYFDTNLRDVVQEYVEDQAAIARYGVNTKKIDAFACTSRGQAHRLGRWLLFAEGQETEVVAFTASIDSGVIVRPGSVIDIADPVRSGTRLGGRISSATATVITLDDATGLTTTFSPTLSVILPDGSVETKAITGISGNAVTVATPFSAAPNTNSVWVYQSAAAGKQTSQWRVISVTEQDDCNYVVNALSCNATKYDNVEYNLALTTRKVSNLNLLPAAPTNISFIESLFTYQSTVKSKIVVGWTPVVGVNQYQIKWRKDQGNWSVETSQGADYEIFDTTPGLYEVEVYSVGATNYTSAKALTGALQALGKTAPPSDVPALTATLDPAVGVTLSWEPVTDLDLQGYEIWQGSAYGVGEKLGIFSATSKKLGLISIGTTTWWIKALDSSGSYSTNATSTSLTITAPVAPTTINGAFGGENFTLDWGATSGSLSIDYYEVRYGLTSSTWATATSIGTVKGTTITTQADWANTRRFFVAGIDITGNVGASNFFDAVVIAPSAPTITQQVIDNNILLQWTDSKQTLPIKVYELRKGNTWASATVIGTKQGQFTTVFEASANLYRYWLAGVDSAGNYGVPNSVSAQVSQPPDYVFKLQRNSTLSGTKTNLITLGTGFLASVDTTETWQQHFTSRGWTTLQDQINAGFTDFLSPSLTPGQYTEEIDYGSIVPSSKITAVLTSNAVSGTVTATPTISVKKLSTDPWMTFPGVSSVFATEFQFIQIQYDFADTGGNDLLAVTALSVRLDSKIRTESGSGTASQTDLGGTLVNFTISPGFVDVDSIVVTPLTTIPVMAVYNFTDVQNPTGFRVLLYRSTGARISGPFSWTARGV